MDSICVEVRSPMKKKIKSADARPNEDPVTVKELESRCKDQVLAGFNLKVKGIVRLTLKELPTAPVYGRRSDQRESGHHYVHGLHCYSWKEG